MPKFKRFQPRGLRFRCLLILAGALFLLAAFGPNANAQSLIAYYNFEGTPTPGFPVNMDSHAPAFFSSGNTLIVSFNTNSLLLVSPGLPQNLYPGDPAPNLTALGFDRSGANSPAHLDIPLFSSQGFFENMTLSFAINAQGNGFTVANLYYSVSGTGGPFVLFATQALPSGGTIIISAPVPIAANNAPNLVLRIELTGGQSNGTNLQNVIDNIRVEGTIVPEPATVAGGLFGVLGLCWHQRRRLIRSVRLRRT